MPVLIIAEKNSAARAIAEALGQIKIIRKAKSLQVYHVPSKDIYVVPLRGHLLEYKNTPGFKSWTKSSPRAIITDPKAIKKIPLNYAKPYIDALMEYGKQCANVIIATDADTEGCNIGLFDALPFVKHIKPKIQVSQMWLSSLQRSEIIKKFNSTITPKWSWGESAEARAITDAVIGFSATREVTNTLRPLLKKFNLKFISIGRVQTSLLYLFYLREDRIKSFIPEPYFTIEANLIHQNTAIKAKHTSNPFQKDKETITKLIYQKIKNEKLAKIVSNESKVIQKLPPVPLNTFKALVLLTKILKISANQAFNTMNTLYLNKIISYPRTDSDIYKTNFNHKQYLKEFTSHSQYGNYASRLINENRVESTKGKRDAGDHPPITPLVSLEIHSTKFENEIQRKVYDIISRHYLALFGRNATKSRTALKLSIKEEPFISRYESLLSDGFFEIAPFLKSQYTNQIEILGNEIPIKNVLFNKNETKPPPKYTDTTLLKLMEKNRLGTKSTRPVIIQLLQDRKLISRVRNKYSITELGEFLIGNLKEIWLPFLQPNFTSEIEDLLDEIKEKKVSKEIVIKNIRLKFLELFDKFLKKKQILVAKASKFEVNFTEKSHHNQNNRFFSVTSAMCPQCNSSPMKFIATKKNRFLVCSNEQCKKYLSLPQRGTIKLLNSICSICGFNVFYIKRRKSNKYISYYICAKCWNEGLTTKSGKGFCSNCEEFKIEKQLCVKK